MLNYGGVKNDPAFFRGIIYNCYEGGMYGSCLVYRTTLNYR